MNISKSKQKISELEELLAFMDKWAGKVDSSDQLEVFLIENRIVGFGAVDYELAWRVSDDSICVDDVEMLPMSFKTLREFACVRLEELRK